MKLQNIKVIGLGGIGTALLHFLPRYLSHHFPEAKLTLIDGDHYESRNAQRQSFDRLGGKADVSAGRVEAEFPGLRVVSWQEYVTEENSARLVRDGDVVLLGVDRHASRLVLSERFCELQNGVLISGGNELTTGNVQVHVRKNGQDVTLPIANEFHPEILRPDDQVPGPNCEQAAAVTPQLLFMNAWVAMRMLVALQQVIDGKMVCDELYLDLETGNARSVARS